MLRNRHFLEANNLYKKIGQKNLGVFGNFLTGHE